MSKSNRQTDRETERERAGEGLHEAHDHFHFIPGLLNWKALCCAGGLITLLYCPLRFPIMPWLARRWLGDRGEEKGLEEPG